MELQRDGRLEEVVFLRRVEELGPRRPCGRLVVLGLGRPRLDTGPFAASVRARAVAALYLTTYRSKRPHQRQPRRWPPFDRPAVAELEFSSAAESALNLLQAWHPVMHMQV